MYTNPQDLVSWIRQTCHSMIEKSQEGNRHLFCIKAANGQTLLNSIAFEESGALDLAVTELPTLVAHSSAFERRTDHNGKFKYVLKDKSGQLLGESQPYSSEAGMENGIANLKRRIADLGIPDSL